MIAILKLALATATIWIGLVGISVMTLRMMDPEFHEPRIETVRVIRVPHPELVVRRP